MRLRLHMIDLASLVVAALLVWAAPARAAMPPLKIAKARQISVRGAIKSGVSVDISVTVLGDKLQNFSATGARLGGAKILELVAENSSALPKNPMPQNKPPTLVIDAQAPVPWSVVFLLLQAPDPIASLRATLGAFHANHSKIELLDGDFVYHYGESPGVVMSRDLSKIRRVYARKDGVDWEFRLSGELGVGGMPERIAILRDGAPFANLKLSRLAK